MGHLYANAFSSDDRQNDRYSVEIVTRMRQLGEDEQALRITDVSSRGFSGLSAHRFPSPSVVAVTLPGIGEVKARVVWTDDGKVGGQFLAALDLAKLDTPFGGISREAF